MNKKTLDVIKHLPETKDRVINLITQFTSENPNSLYNMDIDDLLDYLSKLMELKKKQIEALLVEHNQSKEENLVTLAKLWKLLRKGIVKKKQNEFGTLNQQTFDRIKFIMAMIGDLSRYRVANSLGASTSTITNPNNTSSIKIANKNTLNLWNKGPSSISR